MSKGYFLSLLRRVAQQYGQSEAQEQPLEAHALVFSSPTFSSGVEGNIVHLNRTGSLFNRETEELKTPTVPTDAAFPWVVSHLLPLWLQSPPPVLPPPSALISVFRAELSRLQSCHRQSTQPDCSPPAQLLSGTVFPAVWGRGREGGMEAAIPLLFFCIVYYSRRRGSLLLCHFEVFLQGADSDL